MRIIRVMLMLVAVLGIAACGQPSKFREYNGPPVTLVEVHKADRQILLYSGNRLLKRYSDVGLGGNPVGHKVFEGDQRTPEGAYYIDRRNPNSNFHLSIGISYPNPQDVQVARSMGVSPGGDIFIHGRANKHTLRNRGQDWTDGCIAVTDKEVEEIYAMVRDGTPIHIFP